MDIKDLKQGDIFIYDLNETASYTAIFIDYVEDYIALIDIVNNVPGSKYNVPSADKISLEDMDVVIEEVIGHIDLFKPLYDKYPELLV